MATYDNLKAEMRRTGKTQENLAELLERNESTISLKLNRKKKFTLDEAFTIQREWFPKCTIEYLFGSNIEQAS
jgi:antitoxin component HigA of HigAB toxin-antitoxin module